MTDQDKSDAAKASSAHARINIPLNLNNWRNLPEKQQASLMWFHQYLLDHHLGFNEAQEAIGYDRSTVFRVLKNTYEGSMDKVCKAIERFRRLCQERGNIQQNEIVENAIARLVFGGLDYAIANNSVTTIIGESRMGKTVAAKKWRDDNNHGTSVYVVAPPIGGIKFFMRCIAEAVGVNRNLTMEDMAESIYRAFNKNRILIVDEAHRLMPGEARGNPVKLEFLRYLHDTTGCALAMIATERFTQSVNKSEYMYEQVLGRIGMPVRLPRTILMKDIMPIVSQYVAKPSKALKEQAKSIANERGRLGILVEILKVASRIASKRNEPLSEEHVFQSISLRTQMMGETNYAKK